MAIGRINATLSGVQPGGLAKIVPTSVAVGSGSGSVDANGNVTFSGASSVSLNGCFSSTYDNYKIQITVTAVGSGTDIDIDGRLRASGTDASGSNYKNGGRYIFSNGGGSDFNSDARTAFSFGQANSTNTTFYCQIELAGPFATRRTVADFGWTSRNNSGYGFFLSGKGLHDLANSYDGLTILPQSSNITGTIRVYGFSQ